MKKRIQDFIIIYQLKNCKSLTLAVLFEISLTIPLPLIQVSIRMNPLTPSQMAIFVLGKIVYITCHLLLPSLYMHWALVVGHVTVM